MNQNIPVYIYDNGSSQVVFSPESSFWITGISGDDGLDITVNETASVGQPGTTRNSAAIGSRSITVNGVIVDDLNAGERLLKNAVRPLSTARLFKTVGGVTWYLEGEPIRTPDVSGKPGLLNFQFKFKAFYPYWKTADTPITVLGGLESAWFPTPVSTAGTFMLSRYKHTLDTSIINHGNAATGFLLRMTATAQVTDPSIYHLATGQWIRLEITLLAGDVIEVNTQSGQRSCTLIRSGVPENAFRLLSLDSDMSMALLPGENILRLLVADGRENLRCTIQAPKGVSSGV